MKKLMIITAIVALMSSCTKDEKENPTPATSQIMYNVAKDSSNYLGLQMKTYTAPNEWKIDSVRLNATSTALPMYQDFWLYNNADTTILYDFNSNTESMFGKWISVGDSINSIIVGLIPDHNWTGLDIAISKE